MSDAAAAPPLPSPGRSARERQGVAAWDVPRPVAEWTARDVVRHLTEWFPPFLADGSGIVLTPGVAVVRTPRRT